jgi:dihydroorotase
MPFDLLVHGGIVFHPDTGVRAPADVAIVGDRIVAIEPGLVGADSAARLDAAGALVIPGLVDAHTHVYWGATPLGVDPDALAAAAGVTTWIDAGSGGAGNFEGLVRHVIERSPLTIRAFVHLSYLGLVPVGHTELRFGELFDLRLADVPACVRTLEAFAPHVLGVKVRLGANSTGAHGMDALRAGRAVADATGLRLMVHIAEPPPLLGDALPYLQAGDLVAHCFTPGLMGILDRSGHLRDDVRRARDRGVLFDVGHGNGSFSFAVARAALAQGFGPDLISSDLHAYNVDGPVFDLATTITKFLALGMPFDEVLRRATSLPGELVGDGVGTLRVGGRADLAIVRLVGGDVLLGDSRGEQLEHHERLIVDATVLAGRHLHPDPAARPQGKRKPGLPPVDPRLSRPLRR